MPSSDFSPRKFFDSIIVRWWLLFTAMVIGGILGTGLSFEKEPRFEAQASISTSVDYTLAPELEDYEEDRIINEAGWLMISDNVLEKVYTQAQENGIVVSYQDLSESFSTERIDDLWTLRVAGPDPEIASSLANLWLDEAFSQLDEASEHAQVASSIESYLSALEFCGSADLEVEDSPICSFEDPDELDNEIKEQTTQLNIELEKSRGINSLARFAVVRYAEPPTSPSYQPRGIMAAVGILLGLVSGVGLVWFMSTKE